MLSVPTLSDIEKASERIDRLVHKTPILTSGYFNELIGSELFFKCENFQKGGAFKARGACNAVFSLDDDEIQNGVATHSSGNHAQALSLAARSRGVKAYIVMPSNSAKVKIDGVREYGGEVTFCEPTLEARERGLEKVVKDTGAKFIHPYDDPTVIAGQATAAKELLEDVEHLDMVIAPVGGGGLLSGTSLALNYFSPETKAIGAEPESADDAYRSFTEGKLIPSVNPMTVADGLRTSLSPLTFRIIRQHVNKIVRVSERNIIESMKMTFRKMKIIIEPSAAVPLGALLDGKVDVRGKRVGIIISGGNVDIERLPWLEQGE